MLMDSFDDSFNRHCIGKQLLLSIWPRRCYYTNQSLWFKYCYKMTAMWTGPGTPVFEDRWIDKNEYLLKKIKGDL